MPRLPRNLHLVATWRSPANAICKNTLHDTSKVLRLPRKLPRIFWKRRKSIAPATQNDFRHVTKHLWMSRSATPATRNEATKRLKPPKMTTSAELTIGTAIRGSRERLRTVANSCERLRTVANGCGRLRPWTQRPANTPSTPRPPEWNGNPCYAFGKRHEIVDMCHLTRVSYHYLSSPSLPTCTGAAFNVRRCSELVTGTRKLLFEINLDVCSCQKLRANSAEIRCINGWSSGNACCVAACCCLLCETIPKHPSFA